MVNIDQTTGSRGKHNQPLATLASYRRQKVVKVHISHFLLDFAALSEVSEVLWTITMLLYSFSYEF